MVSVSGIDVKFGRILLLIILIVGLVFLYKKHGTISHGGVEDKKGVQLDSPRSLASKDGSSNNGESEQNVSVSIGKQECVISYLRVNPGVVDDKKVKVLLLHGKKFSAKTWKDTNTLDKLKEWNYTAVAINLTDNNCPKDGKTRGELVHEIVNKLKLKKVVLVSPSMSGQYSIPYIMNKDYMSEIAGFIPIAPVIDSGYTGDDFKKLTELKVMIVQGEKDSLAPKALELLKNIPSADNDHIVTLKGAGHACYVVKPDEWHKNLQQFLASFSA